MQPVLPPIEPSQSERVDLTPVAPEKLSDETAEELRQALERETRASTKITVANERPRKLHPVAEEAEKALREAREDHYGFRSFLSDWNPPLYLAKASIGRAIRLFDSVAKEVVAGGGKVTSHDRENRLVFSGEPFYLRIYELKEESGWAWKCPHPNYCRRHDDDQAPHRVQSGTKRPMMFRRRIVPKYRLSNENGVPTINGKNSSPPGVSQSHHRDRQRPMQSDATRNPFAQLSMEMASSDM